MNTRPGVSPGFLRGLFLATPISLGLWVLIAAVCRLTIEVLRKLT